MERLWWAPGVQPGSTHHISRAAIASYTLGLKIKRIEKLLFWQDVGVLYSKLNYNKICSYFNCYSSSYSVQGTNRKSSYKLFIVALSHSTLDWKCTSLLKCKPLRIILLSEEFINTESSLHYLGQSQLHHFTFCRLLGNQFESSVKHNVKFIVVWRNPRLHI